MCSSNEEHEDVTLKAGWIRKKYEDSYLDPYLMDGLPEVGVSINRGTPKSSI